MKQSFSLIPLFSKFFFTTFLVFCVLVSFSQEKSISDLDSKLLDEFVMARGGSYAISFDASNIKQYWIDKSVYAKDNSIYISLKNDTKNQSIPLKVQLIRLDDVQLCRVDVITDETNLSYSITNEEGAIIATSSPEDDFIQHHIVSASIDFRDNDYTFYFVFESPKQLISIRKIILSFKPATSYRNISVNKGNAKYSSTSSQLDADAQDVFKLSGTQTSIMLNEKILVAHRSFTAKAKIKNNGTTQIRVRLGYNVLSSKGIKLFAKNYPYNGNSECLKVISAETGNDFIIVDRVQEWTKNCFVARNAKTDFSDIPNTNLLQQTIASVEHINDNQSKIILKAPLTQEIPEGELIRITNPASGTALYTNNVVLSPGEDIVLSSTIRKDYTNYLFSTSSLPNGVYYIVPVIITNSIDNTTEHSVVISDYSISY